MVGSALGAVRVVDAAVNLLPMPVSRPAKTVAAIVAAAAPAAAAEATAGGSWQSTMAVAAGAAGLAEVTHEVTAAVQATKDRIRLQLTAMLQRPQGRPGVGQVA